MLLRLLKRSFTNQKKAMAVMVVSVAFGTALAASMLTVASEISGKVAVELRTFGANIHIEPKIEGIADLSGQRRYLLDKDLSRIKTIFWRHNIIGFAPFLEAPGTIDAGGTSEPVLLEGSWYAQQLQLPGEEKKFMAGIKSVSPWWDIDGSWPSEADEVLVGSSLAERLGLATGGRVQVSDRSFNISGILTTGGREDGELFFDLETLQSLLGVPGMLSRVQVSALTTPMNEFAYKDPDTMTRTEYEKWYCTAYVTSVAKQLEEVMTGSRARPVWHVAETEGKVLARLKIAIYLLSAVALLASALGVATTMVTSLLRRVEEIGLMKAIGADSLGIITLFLSEAAVIGIAGGLLGLLASVWISREIGMRVFGAVLEQRAMLFPLSMGISLVIAFLGSLLPISRALRIKAAVVLKGAE